ncbi:ndufs1 NADH-ubiquinone oxidoreductase subunit [Tilletia horrida]|uniref:NADH-ubiquinone oxidoreductase 78 kDa subunit, mitochondrial n=1 Tax=Tilletia horrida TaxID=155126 RepID=A0AAN6GSK8_9BASI|nr:ndufs1 NADH-ubiquinone oxidoreductase subunit [Tilletia horrida]KAK0555949.1 ndufs1 NADH-ubiquinone oxidoreductase subunit [Tilletia horrida]KAK0568837.1 ndufs1 NADH-ubiquinone oxidoreductase subunit [Tilletia horrida]
MFRTAANSLHASARAGSVAAAASASASSSSGSSALRSVAAASRRRHGKAAAAAASFSTSASRSATAPSPPAPEKPPAEVTLTIDGKSITVPQGTALIQACEKAGAQIPRFCYHDRLLIAGNCRMCLVESKGAPKPLASCAFPAMPGQVITTNSPLVAKAREGVLEFILNNHPLDCPICDWGGECDLQDQSMRYGSDRGRFHEIKGKRAVEDKNFGPLIKTVMTRCIHCTRCVRFANDIAGVQELGTSGRGNQLQIGTYIEKTIDSEMSGNVIDLCPVGALTSKPYAFQARPWELKKTESIDVLDAVGSNIRVDSRGVQVMRILPRLNEDVNEEWINDKTRFAYDGLKYQRLTTPLIRQGDRFVPASWPEAFGTIAEGLASSGAKGDQIQAVAGALADTESLVVLKDLVNALGSDNLALDIAQGDLLPAHGVDLRSSYAFNTTIAGLDQADVVLLIGTNPRHEAAIINTRIRKNWLHRSADIGLIGEKVDLTYEPEHLGEDALKAISDLTNGKTKGDFAKLWKAAKKPMVIVGSGVAERTDAGPIFSAIAGLLEKNKDRLLKEDWNGYNVLQRHASRVGAYEVGFAPRSATQAAAPAKFVYLLNADDVVPDTVSKDAFVVYQGHHGDAGAQIADVILPGAAYTEKSVTYVNTEGRPQLTRAAVPPPGAAREDWKILRALAEVLGLHGSRAASYENVDDVRQRMYEISPALVRYDEFEGASAEVDRLAATSLAKNAALAKDGKQGAASAGPLSGKVVKNFYQTDVISRASPTMAKCTQTFVDKIPADQIDAPLGAAKGVSLG